MEGRSGHIDVYGNVKLRKITQTKTAFLKNLDIRAHMWISATESQTEHFAITNWD